MQENAFNVRQLREQVNPKGLPILFELYYLKSILLSYVIKLYYLKSFRVTLRHYREKKQLSCILRSSKTFFEPYLLAVL